MSIDDMALGAPEGITRRTALKLTGGTIAAGAVSSGMAAADDSDDESEDDVLSDFKLFDNHIHLIPEAAEEDNKDALPAEVAIEWMDENGIDKAVVLPLESPTSWYYPVPTWWTFEEVQKYPDRLIPYCAVAPQLADQFGEETIIDRIEMFAEMGAQGVGEIKAPMPINDQRIQRVCEACAEYDLPLEFHMDGENLTDDAGLPKTEQMLQMFPDVDFIGHGPGWQASISGDLQYVGTVYPDGPVEEGGAMPRLLEEYDNCYTDTTAGSGWNALTRDPEFTQSFLEEHHEQIVFGTDKLARDQTIDQFDMFDMWDLTEEQWKNIRYRNLQELWPDF